MTTTLPATRSTPSRTIRFTQVVWLVLVMSNLTLFILGGIMYFRELLTVVSETMQPAHVSLWLKKTNETLPRQGK